MEASGGDAILRVPCFKIVGIFSSQIFMSTKWGWHYFGGGLLCQGLTVFGGINVTNGNSLISTLKQF